MPERSIQDARRRSSLPALLFYSVVTLLVAAPLPLHLTSTVARAARPDVWLNLWALAWTSDHVLSAPLRLFDANIFFPQRNTLAYTDHFIGQALLAAPVYWITDNIALAYNVAWFAALILTAWGAYLWVRTLIGGDAAGEAAALVAGAFCLLVPGKRTALSHLQVISVQGLPLALYATHLLLQKKTWRPAVGLAAATVYAALCSWYTAAYVALALPLVGIGGARMLDDRKDRRRVLFLGAAALLGAAVVVYPVALPFRAVQAEYSFERPLTELIATSLRPIDFVSSWSWLHDGWMPAGSGAGGYFPGFLAVTLMVMGIRDGRRRRDRWPLLYAAAALGFAILALGPRLQLGIYSVPLPYEVLYRVVPGFGALRNPYRAAFIASILLAVPVGYGARSLIVSVRSGILYEQRWRTHPRLQGAERLTLGLAALLALVHLAEAWPGPQEITPLPVAPSPAYEWLARQGPEAATLVWPLPRPFDDNARYQLWTVGSWAPLANGHSGLYPPAFLELYSAGAEFPEPEFLEFVKERLPVSYVLAHYGLSDDAAAMREAAAASGLAAVWSQGDDVIYRLDNGAGGGWLYRRLPRRLVADRLHIDVDSGAAGCGLRVILDGAVVGEALLAAAPPGSEPVSLDLSLRLPAESRTSTAELEMFLMDPAGGPRLDLEARLRPRREATLSVNGSVVLAGPLVVAVLAAGDGRLRFRRSGAADVDSGAEAVKHALAVAESGDELVLAVAEELDYRLIERLRLLLVNAGVGDIDDVLEELATTYAFRGRIGAPRGSAQEVVGEESARLFEAAADDCRLHALRRFRFLAADEVAR